MSEYQYYEFQAIDRPLTGDEMRKLRSYSTRARITPTSFVNDYSWGSFGGDEDAWMQKYFDAFLYLANWGTHIFKLRLPESLLPKDTARLYASHCLSVRGKKDQVVDLLAPQGLVQMRHLVDILLERATGSLTNVVDRGMFSASQTQEGHDGEDFPRTEAGGDAICSAAAVAKPVIGTSAVAGGALGRLRAQTDGHPDRRSGPTGGAR